MYEDKLKELEERIVKIESLLSTSNTSSFTQQERGLSSRESPRGFLNKFGPKNDVENTLVAIHYLEGNEAMEISVNEIEETLKSMRVKPAKNLSDKLQQLDKRGYLLPNGQKGNKKLWLVSDKGREFLGRLKENVGS
jgi:hypothetical protein